MTVTVTMLQTRRGEDGSQWAAGSSYSASDAFAAMLITANLATGTLPQPTPSSLSAAQVAAVVASMAPGTAIVSLRYSGQLDAMLSVAQIDSTTPAVSTSVVVSATASQVSRRVRISSTDLEPLVGCTTNAAGYSAGTRTFTLASAGTGAIYKNDVITFAGQSNEYTILSGDGDVSNGGTITIAGYGITSSIPASATAITLVRRGVKLLIAANCDNAVEALIATQTPSRRDAECVLGEVVTLQSADAVSTVWTSADDTILINTHRLDVFFGE